MLKSERKKIEDELIKEWRVRPETVSKYGDKQLVAVMYSYRNRKKPAGTKEISKVQLKLDL